LKYSDNKQINTSAIAVTTLMPRSLVAGDRTIHYEIYCSTHNVPICLTLLSEDYASLIADSSNVFLQNYETKISASSSTEAANQMHRVQRTLHSVQKSKDNINDVPIISPSG
jgi:hypothetical protein